MKALNIQFDIDTLTCIEQGVPALLSWAECEEVKLSFYINLGKSIDRHYSITNVLKRSAHNSETTETPNSFPSKLSVTQKLGWKDVIRTLAFNPNIGLNNMKTLEDVVKNGHELGLHGGNNHALWQHALPSLTNEVVESSLYECKSILETNFGRISGFCAPGFAYQERIFPLLSSLGFGYFVEPYYGPHTEITNSTAIGFYKGLVRVPVNVISDHTVPYLENKFAQDPEHTLDDKEATKLISKPRFHIYGHPCFEGMSGLPSLNNLVTKVRHHFQSETIGQSVQRFLQHNQRGSFGETAVG